MQHGAHSPADMMLILFIAVVFLILFIAGFILIIRPLRSADRTPAPEHEDSET